MISPKHQYARDTTPFVPTLNRYWAEPAFRSAMDTERSAKRAVIAIEQDRSQIARFVGNDVPGWVHAARERVSAFDRKYVQLITAGISHDEAAEVAALSQERDTHE
jgi:hypothetical protein